MHISKKKSKYESYPVCNPLILGLKYERSHFQVLYYTCHTFKTFPALIDLSCKNDPTLFDLYRFLRTYQLNSTLKRAYINRKTQVDHMVTFYLNVDLFFYFPCPFARALYLTGHRQYYLSPSITFLIWCN